MYQPDVESNPGEANVLKNWQDFVDPEIVPRIAHLDLSKRILSSTPYHPGGAYGDICMGQYDLGNGESVSVAIKRLRIHVTGQKKELFESEIYVWSKLHHENILRLLGFDFDKSGYPLLVSKWMTNGSAWEYVRGIPDTNVIHLVTGIARGLAYMHEMNVIHSDIKPENIVVSPSGDALICDFGCSRVINSSIGHFNPTSGSKGTYQYHAYELLNPDSTFKKHTKETDVWAFGMTVFELWTRQRAYKSDVEAINAILKSNGIGLPSLTATQLPNVPRDTIDTVNHICQYCWKQNPSDRPSINHFVSKLQDHARKRLESDFQQVSDILVPDSTVRKISNSMEQTIRSVRDIVPSSTASVMYTMRHYCFEVHYLKATSTWRSSRQSHLSLTLEIGKRRIKTGEISLDGSLAWNSILTFSQLNESSSLKIRVSEKSKWRSYCVALVDVKLSDLLSDDAKGESLLDLFAPNGSSRDPVCSVSLRVTEIDEAWRTKIDVNCVGQDLKRIERSAGAADPSERVGSVVEVVDKIVESIDDIVENIHPFLNLAWHATKILYTIISSQWKTDKKLIDLVDTMRAAYEFAHETNELRNKTAWLEGSNIELLDHTIQVCYFVKEYCARRFIGRILKITSGQKMDGYRARFSSLGQNVHRGLAVHNASIAEGTPDKVNVIALWQELQLEEGRLQKLKDLLKPIESEASDRPRCLAETRTEYLQQIKDQLLTRNTNQNVVWLNGPAGSGKSTIAASILDYCDDESRLAAYLFFERGKSDPKSILRTIAYQLAAFHPSLATHMPTSEQLRNIADFPLWKQFGRLLLGPLKLSVDTVKGPVIVILDALDECGTSEQRSEILELLNVGFRNLPLEFRFFITSRPEEDITEHLSGKMHIIEIKLESTSKESRSDVCAYINDAMHKLIRGPIPVGFDWEGKMRILGDAASGLFIWASTVVKVVAAYDDRKKKLQDLVTNIHALDGLDGLYATVLEQSGITWQDEESTDRFRKVLGLILFGKELFSGDEINQYWGFKDGKVDLTLQKLRSVLSYEPDKPVRLHHASFADYLLSGERTGDRQWFVDERYQRRIIAASCFEVMDKLLHFNMCNLETSFIRNDDVPDLEDRIAKDIPSYLSYACRFWAEHLHDVPYFSDLASKLTTFAYNYLLYWLEVLSLTKQFNRVAGPALLEAVMWTTVHASRTSSFLWDAYRLVNIFTLPASQSVPHVYLSMLSFLQNESFVSKYYSVTHPTVAAHRKGTKPPTSCIKILHGHERAVTSVAFSPDGMRIVSGSVDRSIRVWDTGSGQAAAGTFRGHVNSVTSVGFSPDGNRIVSGSSDCSIRVWDAGSGEIVAGPFEGHDDSVTSVGFSPNGKRIVSGSSDCSIRVWDAGSGEVVAGPLEGHDDSVTSVGFSPNGKRIVSGSRDCSIFVWDAGSGEVVAGPLEGHDDSVTSVGFSPDGNRIVSGARDCSIRVWDAGSGEVVAGPFEGHSDVVTSVSFSSTGKCIISGSFDYTVRVWDAGSGEIVAGPFEGHTGNVTSVIFSPDARRGVSSSDDSTIRIWDAESRMIPTDPFNRQNIASTAISPDGLRVTVGCNDGKIWIWDGDIGEVISGPFDLHKDRIRWVSFSSDGNSIVSCSGDKTIRFLDIKSGKSTAEPFELSQVQSHEIVFALSPDGKRVAAGCDDSTIWISNGARPPIIVRLDNNERPSSVAFSFDGNCVVSGSDRGNLVIWDAKRGSIFAGPFEGHGSSIDRVVFLPDGKHIVSGSSNGTFWVRDIESCSVAAGPFKEDRANVSTISFSLDGGHVAIGYHDGQIQVYNVQNGEIVTGLLEGHDKCVQSLAFSSDGKRLLSFSPDDTIRIWNVEEESVNQAVDESEMVVRETTSPTKCRNSWTLSEDGWVLGMQGELLTWIPPDVRQTLWHPRNTALLNCQFSTRLDFSDAPLGTKWTKGYSRK